MKKKRFSSELALLIAVVYNSLNLTLLVKADFGISTLSSVPLVLSRVFTMISLGTWTIIVQTVTLGIMLLIIRRFKMGYIFSFAIGIIVGIFVDMWTALLAPLPTTFIFRIIYFILGFVGTGIGAAFFVLCGLPIQPYDLFVREVSEVTKTPLRKTRQLYDLTSIIISLTVSLVALRRIEGVGIGTIATVLFMGSIIDETSHVLTSRYDFEPVTKFGEVLYNIS